MGWEEPRERGSYFMTTAEGPDRWRERLVEGRIGFHQDEMNSHLLQYWPSLVLPEQARVLVPLCGKSSDMLWLRRRGHEVVGVELSAIACRAFFEENELPYSERIQGRHRIFSGEGAGLGLELICGDLFALDSEQVGPIQAWYDRAAVVALPGAKWSAYAGLLASLLPSGAPGLMVTFEYPQQEREGPPFSVGIDDVTRYFGGSFEVDLVKRFDRTEGNRWELTQVFEPVITLVRL